MIFLKNRHGHLVRLLYWCTDQAMTGALESMELTAAQGHVMGYLTHCQEPPCPRDVEDTFQLSHPTVSGLLSRLEQKGFIELRPDEKDRRCKRIFILEKGRQCSELMHRTIRQTEEQLLQGFSEEEREIFRQLLRRAITNMGANPHQHPKEGFRK